MKFIVVDINSAFKGRIKYFIENILFHEVIGFATDGYEFLKMKNIHESDLILINIDSPSFNGLEIVKKALLENLNLKFIAVTNYIDRVYLYDLINLGFKGCVFKNNIYDELERLIFKITAGHFYFSAGIKIKSNSYLK